MEKWTNRTTKKRFQIFVELEQMYLIEGSIHHRDQESGEPWSAAFR